MCESCCCEAIHTEVLPGSTVSPFVCSSASPFMLIALQAACGESHQGGIDNLLVIYSYVNLISV